MIKFLLNMFSKDENYTQLENKILEMRNDNIFKSKKLKEEIDNLYKITTELNSTPENDLNYFMYKNTFSTICVFDKNENLLNFNEHAYNFFKDNYNTELNSNTKLSNILELLNILRENSIVLKTTQTKKRQFISYDDFFMLTIPIFDELGEIYKIILQLNYYNTEKFWNEKRLNVEFEYINFVHAHKNSILHDNALKEYIADNKNIQVFVSKLSNIIHPEDFNEAYNDIMSVIFSNISASLNINCRIKIKNKYYRFIGTLLTILFDDDTNYYNLTENIKFKAKIVGVILDDPYYKTTENVDKFNLLISSLNSLQLSLKKGSPKNITKIKSFLHNIFSFDDMIYVKQKTNNILENKILYIEDGDNTTTITNEVKADIETFIFNFLDNKINKNRNNIYKINDFFIFIKEIKFKNDLSNYFVFISKHKTKLCLFNNEKRFIDIFTSYISKEESRQIDDEVSHVLLDVINNLDIWVWIRDYKNDIVFMNNTLINDLFVDLFKMKAKWRFSIKNNNSLKQLPDNIYNMLISTIDDRFNISINNNNYIVDVQTYNHSICNSCLTFNIAEKIK